MKRGGGRKDGLELTEQDERRRIHVYDVDTQREVREGFKEGKEEEVAERRRKFPFYLIASNLSETETERARERE